MMFGHQKLTVARKLIGHRQKTVLHRLVELVPPELGRDLEADRAGLDAAAAFGEVAAAAAEVARDSANAADDEGVAAEAPARRAIGDEESSAHVVGKCVGERVRVERARAIEDDADVGKILDAAAQAERRADAHAERIDRHAEDRARAV